MESDLGLEIRITDNCNLNCDYCYYQEDETHRTMDFLQIKKVIDFFDSFLPEDPNNKYPITFFGGEPMLKTDLILQTIDYCESRSDARINFAYVINTNGTLFSDKILDEFEKRKVRIFLSLDGGQEVHDTNRTCKNGTGSFDLIKPFIPRLVKMGVILEKVIAINTFSSLTESIRSLKDWGFSVIISQPDFNADWTPELLASLKKEYKKLAREYLKWKKKSPHFQLTLFEDKIQMLMNNKSYKDHTCNMGSKHFVISSDGKIYPCTRLAINKANNPYCMGTVETGFKMKSQDFFRQFQKMDSTDCADCEIKNICLGNQCSCIAYSLSGDINYVSPFVCEHERMIYHVIKSQFFT